VNPTGGTNFTKRNLPGFYSGVEYALALERSWQFFMLFFVFPSILFIFVSYSSFWINKEAAPARVSVGTLSILIQIGLNNSVQGHIPQVPYRVILSDFLFVALIFAVCAMVQYSILNYATTCYNKWRIEINDLIQDIQTYKNKSKELKVLDFVRKT